MSDDRSEIGAVTRADEGSELGEQARVVIPGNAGGARGTPRTSGHRRVTTGVHP